MKQTFAILLVFCFLLPYLSKILIVADFKVNQDFIAEVFCVNKNEPEKECNGKCFLAQQLKEAEESDQNRSRSAFEELLELITVPIVNNRTNVEDHGIPEASNIAYFSSFHPSDIVSKHFHPPRLH